jgi:transcriptional regulator with XRE-family HTH domain
MDGASLTPICCRMARAALRWSLAALADEADVAVGVVRDYEQGRSIPHRNNLSAIVRAFTGVGVVFILHDGQLLVLPPPSTPLAD